MSDEPNDNLADAAVVQLATMAVKFASQVDDPRVHAIKDACLRELGKNNGVETLLKVLAVQTAGPTPEQKRDAAREQNQADWQRMLQDSRDTRAGINKRNAEATDAVLKLLIQKLQGNNGGTNDDDGPTATSVDRGTDRSDPQPTSGERPVPLQPTTTAPAPRPPAPPTR